MILFLNHLKFLRAQSEFFFESAEEYGIVIKSVDREGFLYRFAASDCILAGIKSFHLNVFMKGDSVIFFKYMLYIIFTYVEFTLQTFKGEIFIQVE